MSYAAVAAGAPIYASTINDIITTQMNRPMTRLALGANQSLTNNTATDITFGSGTEVRDDRGWHSTSSNTNRITPDLPGRYLCVANGYFASNATGDRRVYIAKNGSLSGVWAREIANGANGLTVIATGVYELNGSSDYVGMQALQSSGGSLNLQGTGDTTFSTTFEVVYLGGLI